MKIIASFCEINSQKDAFYFLRNFKKNEYRRITLFNRLEKNAQRR